MIHFKPNILQGQEYTDQYLLEYQREQDGPWFRFRNRHSQEVRVFIILCQSNNSYCKGGS